MKIGGESRRRAAKGARVGGVAIATVVALASGGAQAAGPLLTQATQTEKGFAVERFYPAPRGSDWFVLDSNDLRDDARGALGVVGEYAYKPLVVSGADGSERAAVVAHQLVVHPGASLVILERLRLWGEVPFVVYNDGASTTLGATAYVGPSKPAAGDARLGLDLRLFGAYGDAVTGTVGVEGFAPTGARQLYTGDGSARFEPKLQLAGRAWRIEWAVRGGVLLRVQDEPIAGTARGHDLVLGGAVGYRTVHGKLLVGPEIYGSTSLTLSAPANNPLEALLGAHYALTPEWRVGAAIGPGFGTGLGTPLFRSVLSFEYASAASDGAPAPAPRHGPRDRDHDEVLDSVDACPDKPGVETDDPATDGCPPPPDTDGDHIPDPLDACPDDAGSPNAEPESNGCPPDADNDGVADAVDACPLRAGVEQSDPTQNGCPPDSDRDGIIDADDACPDVMGAITRDPQTNGCPLDPDRDHDGIPNDADACPNEAGPRDASPRKNGCPMAVLRGTEIRILEQVRFEAGSARIARGKDTDALLRAITQVLVAHPEIKRLEVQGHTDNRGNAAANRRLSEQRAQAVARWLAGQGLAAGRFTAVGYGDERPIETNATDAGRAANRRVELHALEVEKPPAETSEKHDASDKAGEK